MCRSILKTSIPTKPRRAEKSEGTMPTRTQHATTDASDTTIDDEHVHDVNDGSEKDAKK